MRLLLFISCAAVVLAQPTPTISLNQLRSNSNPPPQNAIGYVGNAAGSQINYDVTHLFYDHSNTRLNTQALLITGLGGSGIQCLQVSNAGVITGFTAGCTPAPTQASIAALWVGSGCGTTTNAMLLNGNCAAGSGSGVSALYQVTDFQVIKTSGTVETINNAVNSTAPAILAVKDTSYPFTSSSTLTISGTTSTGSVYWCQLKNGTLAVYSALSATLTPSSGLSFVSGSSCPSDSRTLWITTMTNNVWDAITEAMDNRAYQQINPAVQPGSFSTNSFSGNVETLGIDPTQVSGTGTKLASLTGSTTTNHSAGFDSTGALIDLGGQGTVTVASGTATLGTSLIASTACATVVTVSATGVATTDAIIVSFNGDPTAVTGYIPSTAGALTIFSYPTANNTNFKTCNFTSSSVTPGAITLNWRVVR